jgi:hypothetical protein
MHFLHESSKIWRLEGNASALGLFILATLILAIQADVCPATVSSACTNCEDGKCTDCPDYYYLQDGNCYNCPVNCFSCQQEICYGCDNYFSLVNYQCVPCQDKHCMFCYPDPQVCSGCEADYELSSDSTCRYKYTLYFVGLIAIGVCLLFVCVLAVNSYISARIKRRRDKQGYGLVLDKDSMMKPTHTIVVTHVQDIGKTSDLNDISTVGIRNPAPFGLGPESKPFNNREPLYNTTPKTQSFLDPNGGEEDREIVEAISQAGSVIDPSKKHQLENNWGS